MLLHQPWRGRLDTDLPAISPNTTALKNMQAAIRAR